MLDGRTIKVVIPALNEASCIADVLAAIPAWVDEVIVADNGSTDATGEIARANGATVVREPRRGYGRACQAGLAAIGFCDVVVFLDGDYSDYPEQMGLLVEPIIAGRADMVLGARLVGRRQRGALTVPQRFGTALACHLMRILWGGTYRDMGPFRAIRWSALRALKMSDPTYGWTVEMQIKALLAQLRVLEAPVSYRRRVGKSKISGTIRGVLCASAKILGTIARYAVVPPQLQSAAPDRLIVFTRYPTPGRTKTRLIPAIGAVPAAQVHAIMAERTMDSARQAAELGEVDVEVRYCGASDRAMRRWLGGGAAYRRQCPGDLGQRLAGAFRQAFDTGCRRVVLVGTDMPQCEPHYFRDALDALVSHDVVLGPTADGGYWLIGLRGEAELFDGIEWGSDSVFSRTVERAAQKGLSTFVLPQMSDVDRVEDLRLVGDRFSVDRPFLSVIVPTFNEVENIEGAIRSARDQGVEIIVVDGASDDATMELACATGVEVLAAPRGRAQQMNAGASLATGEILLFLHADTILPPGYAGRIFAAMLDGRAVGGAHAMHTVPTSAPMRLVDALAGIRSRCLRLPYGDQAIFVRKTAFTELGGFEDVAICEDLLFMRRLRNLGRVVTIPAAVTVSGRRWRKRDLFRGLAINQLIAVGCHVSVRPELLARLYYCDDIPQR